MRLYTKQHKHYCGIDLHTNKMYLCILNQEGEILQNKALGQEVPKAMVLVDDAFPIGTHSRIRLDDSSP